MSLIDDALRRAQAAQHAADPPGSGSRVPMPLPDPGRHRGRRIARVAAGALAAAVLAGAGFLLLRRAARESGVEPAAPTPAVAGRAAAAAATPLPETTVAPPPGAASTSRAVMPAPPAARGRWRTEEPSAAARSATAPAPGAPSAETASEPPRREPRSPTPYRAALLAPLEVSHASASPRVAREERPAERPREERPRKTEPKRDGVKTYAGTAIVPDGKIELGGIAYSETSPTALINGQIVGPGSVVEGYTVVRIEPDRVELRDDGKTIYLTLK